MPINTNTKNTTKKVMKVSYQNKGNGKKKASKQANNQIGKSYAILAGNFFVLQVSGSCTCSVEQYVKGKGWSIPEGDQSKITLKKNCPDYGEETQNKQYI